MATTSSERRLSRRQGLRLPWEQGQRVELAPRRLPSSCVHPRGAGPAPAAQINRLPRLGRHTCGGGTARCSAELQ